MYIPISYWLVPQFLMLFEWSIEGWKKRIDKKYHVTYFKEIRHLSDTLFFLNKVCNLKVTLHDSRFAWAGRFYNHAIRMQVLVPAIMHSTSTNYSQNQQGLCAINHILLDRKNYFYIFIGSLFQFSCER